jgi:hypothetical protein
MGVARALVGVASGRLQFVGRSVPLRPVRDNNNCYKLSMRWSKSPGFKSA